MNSTLCFVPLLNFCDSPSWDGLILRISEGSLC